jgi:hypothetical protein
MRYCGFQINQSDREVMLTSVAFPLQAELWLHKWEIRKWSKDMELIKSDTKATNGDTAVHLYWEASNSNPG